jgi:integrase
MWMGQNGDFHRRASFKRDVTFPLLIRTLYHPSRSVDRPPTEMCVKTVQKLMGHSAPEITVVVYTRVLSDENFDAGTSL